MAVVQNLKFLKRLNKEYKTGKSSKPSKSKKMGSKQISTKSKLNREVKKVDGLSKILEHDVLEIKNKKLIDEYHKLKSSWEKKKKQISASKYKPMDALHTDIHYFEAEFKDFIKKIGRDILIAILREKIREHS